VSKLVYKNFGFLFIVQFSNYVLPFLVIPLLTRSLGLDGFGKYAFYLGIANFLLVFVRFGFEFSATRQISLHSEDKTTVGEIVGAVLQIKAGLLILASIIYAVVLFLVKPDQQNSLLLLGGLLLLTGQMFLPLWYFQGMQQMKFVTLYTVVTKIIYVGALFAIIRVNDDYGYAVVIYGGSFFVAGLLSIIQVFWQVPVKLSINTDILKKVFKEALPFFTSRIFVAAYTSSLVPLIGFIGGTSQVAIYSASEKLYLAAQSVMHPLTNALYPHIAKNRDLSLFKKVFVAAMFMVVIGGTAGYFVAPYLIEFLFGENFTASVDIFNLHIIALVFVFPSLLLGYPLLAALGFSKEANNSVIWGCVAFFMIAVVGYFLGVTETEYFVWAVIIAEVLVFSIRAYFATNRVFYKKTLPNH
jgi:PST family polysaccharide transporter